MPSRASKMKNLIVVKPRQAKRAAAAARVARSLTKNQKKEVKKLVAAPIETKYHAQPTDEYLNQVQLFNTLNSAVIPGSLTTLQPCFPKLTQGLEASQRIGNRVNLTSGRTHFYFYLDSRFTATMDIYVKLFMLNARSSKNQSSTAVLGVNQLLDDGDGTTQDWVPTVANTHILDMYRLNTEAFTGKTKTFRLSKNAGACVNDATPGAPASPNLPQGAHAKFTWNWGKKKLLHYGENGTESSLPQNFYPLWGAVAYYADNTSVGAPSALMPVYLYARSEMFYKDA